MGLFRIVKLVGTTAADGTATIQSNESVNGMLYSVVRAKGTHDNGADLTLTIVNSEFTKTILTLTDANTDKQEWMPRLASCGATGTANSDTNILPAVVGKFQLAVAQGGNAKTGGLYVVVME